MIEGAILLLIWILMKQEFASGADAPSDGVASGWLSPQPASLATP